MHTASRSLTLRSSLQAATGALGLTLGLWACGGSPATRVPTPPQAQGPKALGTLKVNDAGLSLTGGQLAAGDVALITDGRPWPDEATAPTRRAPIVGALTADAQGALWMLHDRPGSKFNDAALTDRVPAGSVWTRPAVSRAEAFVMDVTTAREMNALEGARAVLIKADAPGPLASRILTLAYVRQGKWRVFKEGASNKALIMVRTDQLPADMRALPLEVRLSQGDCDEAQAQAARVQLSVSVGVEEMDRVKLSPSSPDAAGAPGGLTLTLAQCQTQDKPDMILSAPHGERLLKTPFWTPRELTVSDAVVARALMAAHRGDRALALTLLSGREATSPVGLLVQAALALEVGWATDTLALLADGPAGSSLEGRLLRAGAAIELGAVALADRLLGEITAESASLTGSQERLQARVAMARAAVALSKGNKGAAVATIRDALKAAEGTHHAITLQLGMAEVQMARNDRGAFEAALDAASTLTGRDPMQEGTLLRYEAMRSRLGNNAASALNQYQKAAETFEGVGAWRQAATMWRFVLEVALDSDPSRVDEAMGRASQAASQSFDVGARAQVALERLKLFCLRHAEDENPPEEGQQLLQEAAELAKQAERDDLVAQAQRYGLLLVPARAPIDERVKAVVKALSAAHAAGDAVELTLLLSLMGQLEAARFRFKQAEAIYDEAIAFAELAGDGELIKMIQAERAALAE